MIVLGSNSDPCAYKASTLPSEQFSQLLDLENFGMTITKDGAGLFDAVLRFGVQMGSTLLYAVDFKVMYWLFVFQCPSLNL